MIVSYTVRQVLTLYTATSVKNILEYVRNKAIEKVNKGFIFRGILNSWITQPTKTTNINAPRTLIISQYLDHAKSMTIQHSPSDLR